VTYRLRVTARAVADADEAYAWIAEHLSPAQAERWYQGLERNRFAVGKSQSLGEPASDFLCTRFASAAACPNRPSCPRDQTTY